MKRIEWIQTAGGPHLVWPTRSLKTWKGILGKPGKTHYDQACALPGEDVQQLEVKGVVGLVFGSEPSATRWLPGVAGSAGSFVRCHMGDDDDAHILRSLKKLPDRWETLDDFTVPPGGLSLFDSAVPYGEVDEPDEIQSFDLAPGSYGVRWQLYKPDARHVVEVIWLKPE